MRFFGGASLLGISTISVSLSTFISVPIVLALVGDQNWVSIAVGQAIGELSRVFVIWGWNSIGLTIVANLDLKGRVAYYLESIVPRLLLFVVALAVCAGITAVMPLSDRLAAFAAALTGLVYGLNASWLFIGGGEPLLYFFCDALPRSVFTVVAAVALFVVPSATLFGAIMTVGSVVAVCVPAAIQFRRARRLSVPFRRQPARELWRVWRMGFPAFGSGMVLSLRMSFPVILAPVVAPGAAAAVALGDKIMRWANTGMTPLMQSLQVRIPQGSMPMRTRALRGIGSAWLVGGVLGVGVAAVTPFLSPLISSGQIPLTFSMSIPIGAVTMFVFVASITGNSILVLLGRIRSVLGGAAIGLAVICILFFPLTITWGAVGAFTALAVAELTVTIFQLALVSRAIKKIGPTATEVPLHTQRQDLIGGDLGEERDLQGY